MAVLVRMLNIVPISAWRGLQVNVAGTETQEPATLGDNGWLGRLRGLVRRRK